MKLTLSAKDKKLILIFGALALFLALYFAVYMPFTDKTEALEAEIAKKEPRLEQLETYQQNLALYEKSIKEDKAALEQLSVHYPNAVRPEDKIMYAVDLEKDVGLAISAVSFAEPALYAEFPGVRPQPDGYETLSLAGWQSGMSLSCNLSYPELKNVIAYIYDTTYSTALDAVSVSYDSSTGNLTGTMNLSKFYVTGLDDTYRETDAGDIPLGQPNPFRTLGGENALPVQN